MKKIFSVVLTLFVAFTFFSCQKNKVNVVTSSYLTYSIVEQLTKNTKITASTARAPYLNIHNSELTLTDKSKIIESDLLIYFSENVDLQIKKARGNLDSLNLEKALRINEKTFSKVGEQASESEKNIRKHASSHYWSSLEYTIKIIEKIAEKLTQKFENKTTITTNKTKLINEITTLKNDFTSFLNTNFKSDLKDEKILFCGHDSIGAFMVEMGLLKCYTPIDTTIQDRNEDTIKAINEFVELIKKGTKNPNKVLTVFVQEIGKEQVLAKLKSSVETLNIKNVSFKTFHTFHAVSKEEYSQKIPFQTKISENIANLKLALLGK